MDLLAWSPKLGLCSALTSYVNLDELFSLSVSHLPHL